MPGTCHVSALHRRLHTAVLGMLLLLSPLAPAVRAADADVDLRSSLVIGDYAISTYRVEKNYRRFIDAANAPGAQPPLTSVAKREWFSRFLVRQVLLAQALREGFGERLEVRDEVQRMERHMLTQPDGPFYEQLYASAHTPEPDLAWLRAKAAKVYEAEIVRIPLDAPAARAFASTNGTTAASITESSVRTLRESGQAEWVRGSLSWPFAPFEDLASAIEHAPLGSWQAMRDGDALTVYRVARVAPAGLPQDVQTSAFLVATARLAERRRVQRERERQVLRAAGFALDWTAAIQLADRIIATTSDAFRPLVPATLDLAPDMELASYQEATGTRQVVTTADFCRSFNAQFVRRLPRTAADIVDDTRALVVARFDEQAARAGGVADTPKFREDRENYRAALALDLYERERLRPSLGISEAEVERAYHAQSARYARASRAEGRLIEFATFAEAQAFRTSAAAHPAAPAVAARAERHVEVSRSAPPNGFPRLLHSLLFSSGPVPPVAGPVPLDDGFAVWTTGSVTSETTPLSEVAATIRAELEQPLLEKAEADLARTLARKTPVQDRIDYARYDLPKDFPKPWDS